ncbi:MAG TPA: putative toxin-antitoxin system toxin component, PIN family [Thermodesulfovibrionia bacterium]|nr:putative toxin-antitoxin system toxin component, PIN family [Thermodesulfovibrionia bacterium]
MLKVVLDTNVYISAFISSGSKAEEAYLLAVERKVKLYTSVPILTETAKKLREKFLWDDNKITAVLKHISKVATIIKPVKKLNILSDAPDNRILECAKEANANLIVTGDKHLLVLKEYEGIGITRIANFLYSFPSKK